MKADADLARAYAEAGSAPFCYDTRGGVPSPAPTYLNSIKTITYNVNAAA